ncbi:hypothetical protein IT409_00365 [Candidatus Falkowbacteria bacterium]|nr:hypothetical protein [Candidatus Falkowbacteria bacterium]
MTQAVHGNGNVSEIPDIWALRLALKEVRHATPATTILTKARVIQENRKRQKAGLLIASTVMDKRALRTVDLDKISGPQFTQALALEGYTAQRWQILRRCVK